MSGIAVVSVVDALASELRERLFRAELQPGEQVTEASLAQRYGVSRPSAKAAIEQLVSDGLLQRTAHRSARVPELGAADARDIYRARLQLELGPVRALAVRAEVPPAAREANAMIRTLGEGAAMAVVAPDVRFHTSLVDAYGSPRISKMYGSLAAEMRVCMGQVQGRQLLTVDRIASEHEQLLAAIAAGDPAQAERVLTDHLHGAVERLVSALGE